MNLKIIINISLIILFSITIINSAESKELENKSLQEKKQNLINKRIKDLKNNKPIERPNLKGLVPENLEELRYEEEHGRLHKIEDQSYVNLDRKEVYLDYEHQIERFENEFVDQTLDFSLPNAMFEKEKTDPELFKELMENKPEWFDTENRNIVNYAFFQYIKPNEIKMLLFDMSANLANSFEFFYFENGINLKKVVFKNCSQQYGSCINKEEKLSIIFNCHDKGCSGSISDLNRNFFIIDEQGRLFIYNQLDKEGNLIPFIHGYIDED
tara:strand:+ start:81 stop:887 length:807 start_codon:yes stop_codon:yes gene_type:complete